MKKSFLNLNKDTIENDVIFKHLFELSDGRINLMNADEDLSDATDLMKAKKRFATTTTGKKSHKSSSNRPRKRY